MKTEELFIGAWVQELSPTVQRLTPPMMVTGIFMDNTAYLELEDHEGDPFECNICDLRGIPVTPELLLENGFTFSESYLPTYALWGDRDKGVENGVITVVFHSDGLAMMDVQRTVKKDSGRVHYTTWQNPLCLHHLQTGLNMLQLDHELKP